MPVRRRLLLYAEGGAGKSSQAAKAADWIWEKRGLRTRVVNADGGGTQGVFQSLIDKGACDYWDVDTWDQSSIFEMLDLATKGWWPSDPEVPNSPLEETFPQYRECTSCKAPNPVTPGKQCLKCGTVFGAGTVLPLRQRTGDIGCYIFEGMTAFGELLLRRLRQINPEGGNFFTDEKYKISAPGKGHYGGAQTYLAQFVGNSRRLPVEMVLWTALEYKKDDDGPPLYGPAGPGKVLTSACIPWFNAVLHLDVLAKMKGPVPEKDANGQLILERKLYLQAHFPPDNVNTKFLCKMSAPYGERLPGVVPADLGALLSQMEAIDKGEK